MHLTCQAQQTHAYACVVAKYMVAIPLTAWLLYRACMEYIYYVYYVYEMESQTQWHIYITNVMVGQQS